MYFFTLSAGEKWTHFLQKSVTTSICFSGLLKIVYTFFCIKQVNEFFFLINVQWTKGRNQYNVEKGLTLVQFNFRSLFVVKNITLLKLKHNEVCVFIFSSLVLVLFSYFNKNVFVYYCTEASSEVFY